MGRRLVIRDADFSANAVYFGGEYRYVNNSFTWGKGGINTPGTSSGSTNPAMSMVGLPLEHADETMYFKAANGYKIVALLTSDIASPQQVSQYTYVQYSPTIETLTIPQGKYYQIAITNANGSNADISVGYKSLQIRELVDA